MNFTGGLFTQLSEMTGLTSIAKWFGDFHDENLDEMAALLREWPDCPPYLQKELDQDRPPPKGKIHHHLVACRNDPVLALEHIKLMRNIREAFRNHICLEDASDHVKFANFRSAVFIPHQPHDPAPEQSVMREFCHGKIGLVGASEGGVTYLLNGRLHLPSENKDGFSRESSIRLGALVIARLSLLASQLEHKLSKDCASEDTKPPPEVDVNVIVDLTDSGVQNLDRGFGLSMGELIEAMNLRKGDDPIPSAPCIRFRKMIIINANWVYTAVWQMVRHFVAQEYLDIISFESPSQVPELVLIPPSRLPSSLGGTIPLDFLLSPSPENPATTPVETTAVETGTGTPSTTHTAAAAETSPPPEGDLSAPDKATAIDAENKDEEGQGTAADSSDVCATEGGRQDEGGRAREGLGKLQIVPGTCRWFEATTKFFVDPPLEWQGAVPSLDGVEGMVVIKN